MKIIAWTVLMALIAAPLWAGSLEITTTDRSGQTTKTKKIYPDDGSKPKGAEGPPPSGSGGRPGAIQSPYRISPGSAPVDKTKDLFQLTDKMLREMDKGMDSAVEEFKKDAEKVE